MVRVSPASTSSVRCAERWLGKGRTRSKITSTMSVQNHAAGRSNHGPVPENQTRTTRVGKPSTSAITAAGVCISGSRSPNSRRGTFALRTAVRSGKASFSQVRIHPVGPRRGYSVPSVEPRCSGRSGKSTPTNTRFVLPSARMRSTQNRYREKITRTGSMVVRTHTSMVLIGPTSGSQYSNATATSVLSVGYPTMHTTGRTRAGWRYTTSHPSQSSNRRKGPTGKKTLSLCVLGVMGG